MLMSVVDTAIVISSSDEEVSPEPENEDVIITSDTEEEKGMWDSFVANNAIGLPELDKKSFAKQKSVICVVDTANEPPSEKQEDEEAFHREVVHELMRIKDIVQKLLEKLQWTEEIARDFEFNFGF